VRVDSEKVVDYQMREPFKTYFKTHKISNGRVGAINLEHLELLLDSLKTYWNYSNQQGLLNEMGASPSERAGVLEAPLYEL
jgi:hypothetical protein